MSPNINAFLRLSGYIIVLFSCMKSVAQEGYFQQKVNYEIDVKLDDQKHYLYGNIKIEYINQSPDTLSFIYFHLWPNAYRNKNTAFAKQNLRTGNLDFHFSDSEDNGGIKDLKFTATGESLKELPDPVNIDITKVLLNKPLAPGQKIIIESPFTVKIPGSFSRLGHVKQGYQITQWYPKPAVYDKNGWHPMPYLDMGEFYSEFGDFTVRITLPSDYVVAASGELITASEKEFLKTKLATDQKSPQGSPPITTKPEAEKTIEFRAKAVHDFAWFADKQYIVEQSSVELPSGRTIYTNTFYRPKYVSNWAGSVEYVNRSVLFYSDQIGEYPYPQATAVDGALVAGGGMEYPMITVIGGVGSKRTLDNVITHEVGHNWFYGILASNERVYPWMDEGLNSFYEQKYMDTYYPAESDLPPFLSRSKPASSAEVLYLLKADMNNDRPICGHSDAGSSIDYYLSGYMRPAMALKYLESYLGDIVFKSAMQSYYETWKFKHPGPEDLKKSFEDTTGKDLSWFFNDVICSNKQASFKIAGIDRPGNSNTIKLKNTGDMDMPVPLKLIHTDSTLNKIVWTEPFENEVNVPIPNSEWSKVQIDASHLFWFTKRRKHILKADGSIPVPFRFGYIPKINHKDGADMYIMPLFGANATDGFMLGVSLHNYALPIGKFEWHVAPMYAFGSNRLVGLADLGYHIFPQSNWLKNIRLGLGARSFQYRHVELFDTDLRYIKLQPSIEFEFFANDKHNWTQHVRLRSIHIWEENVAFDMQQEFTGTAYQQSWIKEIQYKLERNSKLNPLKLRVALEQQNYTVGDRNESYLKAWTELNNKIAFQKNKYFSIRFFAGAFLQNSRNSLNLLTDGSGRGHFSLFGIGALDYKYDEFYVGRRENEGLGSQQIQIIDGGFKNAITSQFSDGISSRYVVALNLYSDLPQLPSWLPIRPYADLGISGGFSSQASQGPFDDRLFWSAGVQLALLRGGFLIHFPIVSSSQINRFYQERGNFLKRITFSWSLGKKRPGEIIRMRNIDNFVL